MTLNPRAHQLASRVDEEGELTMARLQLTAGKQPAKSPAMRWLYGWAEYHPREFGRKSTQLGLTDLDMSILHGETLRAGSSSKEYKEFSSWIDI